MSEQPNTEPWPEGVLFRYQTLVEATVDLRQAATTPAALHGECTGCASTIGPDENFRVKQAAQAHAETCRALPRPEAQA